MRTFRINQRISRPTEEKNKMAGPRAVLGPAHVEVLATAHKYASPDIYRDHLSTSHRIMVLQRSGGSAHLVKARQIPCVS